ncbi:hypothetical protein [Halapricum sp. CBA1109]|jgi:hypothetical protein|nr:hypothetical protein [Halapricum sp. CBA1109]
MLVPLAESTATVNGAVINAVGAVVTVGSIALTLAWLAGLYRD